MLLYITTVKYITNIEIINEYVRITENLHMEKKQVSFQASMPQYHHQNCAATYSDTICCQHGERGLDSIYI
jgi:hypothetical protein